MRFKERVEEGLAAKGCPNVNWGSGVWQRVLAVYALRKDFTHVAAMTDSAILRPPTSDAEEAISTMREAVRGLAKHAGVQPPHWVADDTAATFGSRVGSFASGTVIEGGVDPNGADTIRITYVWQGREHVARCARPDTPWEPLLDSLQEGLNVPATAIRAYRGPILVAERQLNSRRSTSCSASLARS